MEINDFAPFAALSIGQAKEIIAGIVHDAISDAKQKAQPTQESQAEVMNIDDAVVFLKENGLPIPKKSLYGKTFSGTIPFKRIGKRLVFSRKELLQWIESRTYRPHSQSDEALRLAESARKK